MEEVTKYNTQYLGHAIQIIKTPSDRRNKEANKSGFGKFCNTLRNSISVSLKQKIYEQYYPYNIWYRIFHVDKGNAYKLNVIGRGMEIFMLERITWICAAYGASFTDSR